MLEASNTTIIVAQESWLDYNSHQQINYIHIKVVSVSVHYN